MKTNTKLLTRLFALVMFATMHLQTVFSQALTVGEVFDFQVGDEMGIQLNKHMGPMGYRYMKVTDRKDFGNDSLKISFNIITYVFDFDVLEMVKEYKKSTVTYFDLDSSYFADFAEKDTIIIYYDQDDTLKEKPIGTHEFKDSLFTDSCNTLVNWRNDFYGTLLSGSTHWTHTAYKGLGVLEYFSTSDGSNGTILVETFIYYIKNNKICGNKKAFPISINESEFKEYLIINPNPASDFINVQTDYPYHYKIIDQQGQEILNGENHVEGKISISDLTSGLYFIVIESEGKTSCRKFLVE